MLSFSSLFIIGCYWIQHCHAQCGNEWSCDGTTRSSSGNIECVGYHSCDSATLSSTSGEIRCSGSYSCFNSPKITGKALCRGLFACAYTDHISGGDQNVNCLGEKSCFGVGSIESNTIIQCHGFRSCMNSTINVSNQLSFEGYLSGQDSFIISDGDSVHVDIFFYGSKSGYDATFICNDGDLCNIYCYNDACDELTVVSYNNSDNIDIYCSNDAHFGTLCPDGIYVDAIDEEWPSLFDIAFSLEENNQLNDYDPCNQHNNSIPTRCVNSWDCASTNLNNDGTYGPICCSAKQACQYSTITTYDIIGLDNNRHINKTGIVCDGHATCQYGDINAQNGGHIFLSAIHGGQHATMMTTSDYDIFCTARVSCQYATIKRARNLYCLASYACLDVKISNISQNVYIYRYEWTNDSDITINDIGGSVYGVGYKILHHSDIKNIQGILFGLGFQVLSQSKINNVTEIYCNSMKGLKDSNVSNINTINVNGTDSLIGSIISSSLSLNNKKNTNFELNIYDSNIESFIINCTFNDTCFVGCYHKDACDGMTIYCEQANQCFVYCDSGNGITCPDLGSGRYTQTQWSYTTTTTTASTSAELVTTVASTNNTTATTATTATMSAYNASETQFDNTTQPINISRSGIDLQTTNHAYNLTKTRTTQKETTVISETVDITSVFSTTIISGTSGSSSVDVSNNESFMRIILIILSIIFCFVVIFCWIVSYLFFQQKSKVKNLEQSIQSSVESVMQKKTSNLRSSNVSNISSIIPTKTTTPVAPVSDINCIESPDFEKAISVAGANIYDDHANCNGTGTTVGGVMGNIDDNNNNNDIDVIDELEDALKKSSRSVSGLFDTATSNGTIGETGIGQVSVPLYAGKNIQLEGVQHEGKNRNNNNNMDSQDDDDDDDDVLELYENHDDVVNKISFGGQILYNHD